MNPKIKAMCMPGSSTNMTQYPKKVSELPNEEFFVILKPTATLVPGDLRSQTNPGHGYPAHEVKNWDMEVFTDREEWELEVIRLQTARHGRNEFKAARMIPARIKTTVNVGMS